jgi:hypothetical protein
MRNLFLMLLGAALLIGAAYIYDSRNRSGNGMAVAERPLVNWDVVAQKVNLLTAYLHERFSTTPAPSEKH